MDLLNIAEGVETKRQLRFLQDEKCDQYQGLLFSPPVSSDKLFEMLSASN